VDVVLEERPDGTFIDSGMIAALNDNHTDDTYLDEMEELDFEDGIDLCGMEELDFEDGIDLCGMEG